MLTKAQQYYRKKRRIRNALETKAKKLWEARCIEKWGDVCEVCGKGMKEVHHFFPKGRFSILKYDVNNGIILCQECHFNHHFVGIPIIHATIIKKRGNKWYQSLLKKSQEKHTYNNLWIEGEIKKLEK